VISSSTANLVTREIGYLHVYLYRFISVLGVRSSISIAETRDGGQKQSLESQLARCSSQRAQKRLEVQLDAKPSIKETLGATLG